MKEKTTVRYVGYKPLADGGRGFEFSVASIGATRTITIEASADLFLGPDRIAIQECAGICYETLRSRIEGEASITGDAFSLNAIDVEQHRKRGKAAGRRH